MLELLYPSFSTETPVSWRLFVILAPTLHVEVMTAAAAWTQALGWASLD